MSYVIAAPEMTAAAATDLAGIGSMLSAAHTAAAPTAALIPAAADEVSASIAHLFSQYGEGFQALAGKASAFHDQFVQNLKASAGWYAAAEATNAAALSPVIVALNDLFNVWHEVSQPVFQALNTLIRPLFTALTKLSETVNNWLATNFPKLFTILETIIAVVFAILFFPFILAAA